MSTEAAVVNDNIAEDQAEVATVLPLHKEPNEVIRPQVKLDALMDNVAMNPLIACATPLLAGLVQLKHNPVCEDMHVLQQNLIKEVINFESKAKQQDISAVVVDNARYVLCACFDEVILNYCSDRAGNELGQNSLISVFYHETSGGENVFVLLEKLLHNPSHNINLLELISLCLSLGFEGRYRVMERGFEQLGILRDQLWRCIRQQRGDVSKTLFSEAEITNKTEPAKHKHVSLGIIISATMLALIIVGFGFNFTLTQDVKPVAQMLQQM
jgi:type VI secretion system protein ImpK